MAFKYAFSFRRKTNCQIIWILKKHSGWFHPQNVNYSMSNFQRYHSSGNAKWSTSNVGFGVNNVDVFVMVLGIAVAIRHKKDQIFNTRRSKKTSCKAIKNNYLCVKYKKLHKNLCIYYLNMQFQEPMCCHLAGKQMA